MTKSSPGLVAPGLATMGRMPYLSKPNIRGAKKEQLRTVYKRYIIEMAWWPNARPPLLIGFKVLCLTTKVVILSAQDLLMFDEIKSFDLYGQPQNIIVIFIKKTRLQNNKICSLVILYQKF